MRDYYCECCKQTKLATEFSKWLVTKKAVRRCNDCRGKRRVKSIIENEKAERECKRNVDRKLRAPALYVNVPMLNNREKCKSRDRIAEIKSQQKINSEFELN